jgi:hypothetical protein
VAFVIFALHESVLGYAALSGSAPGGAVIGSLLAAFATLVTISGARGATRRRLALASITFLTMFVLSWWVHYHADAVFGRHSVLSGSPICSTAHSHWRSESARQIDSNAASGRLMTV